MEKRGYRKSTEVYEVDTGCDEAPSCLNCPFPFCKYDVDRATWQRMKLRLQQRERVEVFNRFREMGLLRDAAVKQAALELGVGERTVYRSLDAVERRK